jgi:signal peptidase
MKNPKEKNLVSTIANIISTIVLMFSIGICVLVIISMKSSSGVAQLFGYSILSVQSDSMEPVFSKSDLIVIHRTKPFDRFEVGDIVSFVSYDSAGTRFVNTHRIVQVSKGETRDRYTTKGDNAIAKDRKTLYSNSIIGEYTGKKVAGLGKYVDFVNSPTGVLLCVVIPSAIIIIAQVVNYSTSAAKRKRQMLLAAEERARQERIQLVNDVVAAQRGAAGGTYVQTPAVDPDVQFDEPEKQRVIQEFLQKQAQEEAKKQAIIEEYLYKQKQAEQAAKEEAEAAKIKAIISEFLAQQHQTEDSNPASPPADASAQEDEQA